MKTSFILALGLLGSITCAQAQARAPQSAPPPEQPLPPVYPAAPVAAAPAPAPGRQVYVYNQKPLGGRSYLIAPEQAQSIIDRFKEHYAKLGSPRFLIYINRELIDENSGMKLTSHKRVVETTRTVGNAENPAAAADGVRQTERASSTNIFRARDRNQTPLADRQTVRDVERLFGRALRLAQVHLADQRVATQLMGAGPVDNFAIQPDGEQALKDRQAVSKIADVVLEVLVSSKDATIAELAGDRIYTTPDIQVTAIRLSDSKIVGQATAADLIGQGPSAARAVRSYGVREIAEATALSLMEDMMLQQP
jgi:hypothetical protein